MRKIVFFVLLGGCIICLFISVSNVKQKNGLSNMVFTDVEALAFPESEETVYKDYYFAYFPCRFDIKVIRRGVGLWGSMTIEVSDAYEVGDIVTIEMPNGLTECFESGSMSDRPSECEGVSCSETFEDLDTPIS